MITNSYVKGGDIINGQIGREIVLRIHLIMKWSESSLLFLDFNYA